MSQGFPICASGWLAVRARPGRLSDSTTFSVFHSKSILCGAFVWVRRALNSQKRRFAARAVRREAAGGRDVEDEQLVAAALSGACNAGAGSKIISCTIIQDDYHWWCAGLLTHGGLGFPQEHFAPRRGPLGSSPDTGKCHGKRARASARTFGSTVRPTAAH